jgi:uncharacterized protein DUF3995
MTTSTLGRIIIAIVLAVWIAPDRRAGRPSLRNRVTRSSGAAAKRRRPGVAAAYAAAVLAFAYAAVSMYWAAGGTALLSTVGGSIEDIGRHGGLPAVALGLASAGLKLAGGILALALVRPWGRAIPRAWLLACAAGACAVLACYGAIQVTAGSLVLSRAVRPAAPVDWPALGWHVLVWDMWFLIWGIFMATATTAWWRQGRHRGPAASLTGPNRDADLA